MTPASQFKMQADLAAIERLAEQNLKRSPPWHDGVDVTHLHINPETEAELAQAGYQIERSANCTFVRWR